MRDDDNHHFARFKVDASDNITVEIWAFAGDGTPAYIFDQFTYNLGAGVAFAPVNTVPGRLSTVVNQPLEISGLKVADMNSPSLTTTLTVLQGVLSLSSSNTGNDTNTIVLTGTISQINTALASLIYKANPDYTGSDTLTITTSDGSLHDADNVQIVVSAPLVAGPAVVAVNVGGGAYTNTDTNPDTVYAVDSATAPHGSLVGSTTAKITNAAIGNTTDDLLYQSYRSGSDFGYNIGLANADYILEFQFAETYWTAAGKRVFDVHAEGQEIISNLDVFAAAGGKDKAYTVNKAVTVTDGELNIRLETTGTDDINNALLNGLVVHATGGGTGGTGLNVVGGATTGNDSLTGTSGNDFLDGGAGADSLRGLAGDDTYVVDNAGDTVTEVLNEGTDTIKTSLTSYTLGSNVEALTYTGTAAFTGTGNALANTIMGSSGADKLDGKAGGDTLTGGAGNDTFGFSTVLGSGNLDRITDFVAADDTIQFDAGAFDGLTAGPLAAAAFKDLSTGTLDADDRILYDRSTGSLSYDADGGGSGAAVQFAILDNKATISAADFVVIGTGTGGGTGGTGLNVVGGATTGNDSLTGTSGNDLFDGGAGADSLTGLAGDDTYVVDNAGDIVKEAANEGTDTIKTSLTSYTLGSNVEVLIYTGTAAFTGTGNALANTITGSSGADKLDGKAGGDTLTGGAGNDTYYIDNAGDVVVELAGQGTDRVVSQVSYVLSDNVENLSLGTSAALSGTGNGLANVVTGNAGANVLDGKGGADTLTGGAGNDTFVFQRGEISGDKVTDFTGAGTTVGDQLEFRGFGTDAAFTHAANSDLYTITANAAHGGTSETFQLVGVTALDLLTGSGHNDVLLVI